MCTTRRFLLYSSSNTRVYKIRARGEFLLCILRRTRVVVRYAYQPEIVLVTFHFSDGDLYRPQTNHTISFHQTTDDFVSVIHAPI